MIIVGQTDWSGKKVEKDMFSYPYSYDEFVIYKKKQDYQHAVYSDRLLQWDSDKHNRLCKKHFGNEGQYWDNRDKNKIEAFLRDYTDNKNLQLVGIVQGCNISSGYPYWIFYYDEY